VWRSARSVIVQLWHYEVLIRSRDEEFWAALPGRVMSKNQTQCFNKRVCISSQSLTQAPEGAH
jgi:hypothetical protein